MTTIIEANIYFKQEILYLECNLGILMVESSEMVSGFHGTFGLLLE